MRKSFLSIFLCYVIFQDIERFEKLTKKRESLIKEIAARKKSVCALCSSLCGLYRSWLFQLIRAKLNEVDVVDFSQVLVILRSMSGKINSIACWNSGCFKWKISLKNWTSILAPSLKIWDVLGKFTFRSLIIRWLVWGCWLWKSSNYSFNFSMIYQWTFLYICFKKNYICDFFISYFLLNTVLLD